MTMPHKICPQCGQPAVLAMTQCRRCGFVYVPIAPVASGASPTPRPMELPSAQRALQQSKKSANPLALLIFLVLGVLVFGIVVRVAIRSALRQAGFPVRRRPHGAPLNSAPADATSSPGKVSLFAESDSPQEMPVLTFRNRDASTLTLTLRDRFGHVYRASSRAGEVATLQVPAGDYSVSIDSDNPRILPNWGDAVFRKFKSYQASFQVGHSDTRIHLGD